MTEKRHGTILTFTLLNRFASDFRWGLTVARDAAPGLIWAWSFILLLQGMLSPALIVASRSAINSLASNLEHRSIYELLTQAAFPLSMIGMVLLLMPLLDAVGRYIRSATSERMRDHVQILIHRKAATLDLAFFESSDSYDLLHRARIDALSVPAQLTEHVGGVIQSGLSLMAIAIVLFAYTSWLPLLLIASALPGLWVVGKYALSSNRWRLQNTHKERQTRYQDWMLTQRESAAEIRLFKLGDYFRESFITLRTQLRNGKLSLELASLKAEFWATVVSWLGVAIGMLWIVSRAAAGAARLGDVVMCYQSFQQGQRFLRTFFDGTGGIYKSLMFLANLREFLSLQPLLHPSATPHPMAMPIRGDVKMENVTFSYPEAGRPTLNGVTLDLRARTVTAIVGDNGAGKSTLIKLLCRFYDPSSGRILLDGVDIRELPIDDLRRCITVLFQEPLRHHSTAADNIALSDLAFIGDSARIKAAAVAAGADIPIDKLPQGYETLLGKWFGQAELSTGEWQRIALARAFLRKSSIILLDEPTSAMDAWAETDWLNRFRTLVKGQTSLIITHRFTTAMMADYVYVMQGGRVTEAGSHAELLESNGHYAKAWHEQMRFRDEEYAHASSE